MEVILKIKSQRGEKGEEEGKRVCHLTLKKVINLLSVVAISIFLSFSKC